MDYTNLRLPTKGTAFHLTVPGVRVTFRLTKDFLGAEKVSVTHADGSRTTMSPEKFCEVYAPAAAPQEDPYFTSEAAHLDLAAASALDLPGEVRGAFERIDAADQARVRAFIKSNHYLIAREHIADAFQSFLKEA